MTQNAERPRSGGRAVGRSRRRAQGPPARTREALFDLISPRRETRSGTRDGALRACWAPLPPRCPRSLFRFLSLARVAGDRSAGRLPVAPSPYLPRSRARRDRYRWASDRRDIISMICALVAAFVRWRARSGPAGSRWQLQSQSRSRLCLCLCLCSQVGHPHRVAPRFAGWLTPIIPSP